MLIFYMDLNTAVGRLSCFSDLLWSLRLHSQFNVCHYLSPTGDLRCSLRSCPGLLPLCLCGYLRGLTYLTCLQHSGSNSFASEKKLLRKSTDLKATESCTFTPSLQLTLSKALSLWMLPYVMAKLYLCSEIYNFKSRPVPWSLHLDQTMTAYLSIAFWCQWLPPATVNWSCNVMETD